MSGNSISRRRFLAQVSGASAALAAGLGKASAQAEPEKRNMQDGMTYRVLGGTNLLVSCLSFGGIQLQDDRLNVLEMAVDRGVNFVHTNRGYNGGNGIVSMGKFLKNNRDRVWVALKSAQQRVDAASLDEDLRALQTDHVDVLCVHDLTPEELRSQEITDKFMALRDAGKVRFLNLTDHNDPATRVKAAVESGMYTSCQPSLQLPTLEGFLPVFKQALDANVGIVVMKSMNNTNASPQEVVRAMLAGGATTVLKTLNSVEEANAFLDGVKEEVAIADLHNGIEHGRRALAAGGVCTFCAACTEHCPQNVAVSDIMRSYTYYYRNCSNPKLAREHYMEVAPTRMASACAGCDTCTRVCPQGLAVREMVQEAHARILA